MNNNNRSTTTTTTPHQRTSTMKSSLFSNTNGSTRRTNSGGGNSSSSASTSANNNNSSDRERSQQEVDDVIRENDAMLTALQGATGRMHEEASRLRNEAREHNQIVEQLLRGIGAASTSVRGTVARLDGVMAKHGMSGTAVLSVGVFVAFVLLYFLMKYAWNYHRTDATAAGATNTGK